MQQFGHAQYLPLSPQAYAALGALLLLATIVIEIRLLRFAYMQLGMSSRAALLLLLVSLAGSYVNIPIATLGQEPFVAEREVEFFGMVYRIPELLGSPEVVLAVNLGGAVTPTLLSIYLLTRHGLWLRGIIATLLVAIVCHSFAQPIRGVGIGLPIFVAPLAAAAVALLVDWRHAAPLAYAGGSLGVLIGADLANLDKLQGLGAPVLSIGGAGTFDGIFVTGVVAVLLAGISGGRAPPQA